MMVVGTCTKIVLAAELNGTIEIEEQHQGSAPSHILLSREWQEITSIEMTTWDARRVAEALVFAADQIEAARAQDKKPSGA